MASKIIDLSMTTDGDPVMDSTLTHLDHAAGAAKDQQNWDIDPKDWPFPGNAFADDVLDMSSHTGTHMDAPIHFGPKTIPDGATPRAIDQVPLEWCYGPGVVIDIRDLSDGYELSQDELEERVKRTGHQLQAGDIFLVMTGNDRYWGQPNYNTRGGHLGRAALKWVLEHGITIVGTDSWSFDRAYEYWSADYHQHDRDPSYLWPCHLLGLELEYCHIEKLTNLDRLPPQGFTVYAFPIKFAQGTAGFVRAVAFLDE